MNIKKEREYPSWFSLQGFWLMTVAFRLSKIVLLRMLIHCHDLLGQSQHLMELSHYECYSFHLLFLLWRVIMCSYPKKIQIFAGMRVHLRFNFFLSVKGMGIIEQLDPMSFTNYLKKYRNTICGRHPIGVLLNVGNPGKSLTKCISLTLVLLGTPP